MPKQPMTVWLDHIAPVAGRDGALDDAGQRPFDRAEVTMLDADKKPIGGPVVEPLAKPEWTEHADDDGNLCWTPAQPPLTLKTPIPENACSVQIKVGNKSEIFAIEDDEVPPPKDTELKFFGSKEWTLLAVADMFSDRDEFWGHCDDLYRYIVAQTPFDEVEIKQKFGVIGAFRPSGKKGFFGVPARWAEQERLYDEAYKKWESGGKIAAEPQKDRRVYGVNAEAAAYVKELIGAQGIKPQRTIVLLNFGEAGGAGGDPDGINPTWASIAKRPHENWQDLAVHELGHACGLQDEYTLPWGDPKTEPKPNEINVTKVRDANSADCPWNDLVTPGLDHDPTWPHAKPPPFWTEPSVDSPPVIGTFLGACYREKGRYRSSYHCRMRAVPKPFCEVCKRQIRKVILGD